MAEKEGTFDYQPDDLDRTTDHAPDETETPIDYEPEHDTNDDIRPEDSVSNVSVPFTTTSIARSVKARRVAMRLQKIDEEIALADQERKMKMERFEREATARRKKEALEEEKRYHALELERRRLETERDIERKLRILEEENERKRLEDEQRQDALNEERKRMEAEMKLREMDERGTWVSYRSSKSGSKTRSGSRVSVRRPRKQSTPVMAQPTSFLMRVTPERGIFSDESGDKTKTEGAATELSLPPSYTTDDPREASFTFAYKEIPRETKTMAGNTAEADDGEGATGDEETAAHRAEEAAKQAEYALEMARQERAEIAKERKAFEAMQRTANQTVQQFAKAAADTAKPQLDMLADQTKHLSTAMKSMNLLSTQNSLMVTKISKFTGNPRDYKRFMANFEQNIAAKCDGEAMKLNVLIEHCDGPAKSLIEDCIFLTVRKYQKAVEILEEEYGQDEDIAADYLDFLKSGTEIKHNDVDGLSKLAQEMTKCKTTLQEIGYESDLNAQVTINSIVDRLPSYLRTKWVDKANECRKKRQRPTFETLREFIADRARSLRSSHGRHYIESINAKEKSTQQAKKTDKKPAKGKQSTTALATQTTGTDQTARGSEAKEKKCTYCKGEHHINACSNFAKIGLPERTGFVKENRLCFNCLYPGHMTLNCRNSQRCSTCKLKHHSLIHDENYKKKEEATPKQEETTTVSCTQQDKGVLLRTLPVRIIKNGVEIVAVAMLDCGAQSSLATNDLFSKLQIKSAASKLHIKTITGESKTYDSGTSTVTVKSLDNTGSVEIDCLRSMPNLPISRNCHANRDICKKFAHLRDVPIATMDEPVCLLIGSDTPEAFRCLEERRGGRKEPIAIKTPLGWTVQGPTGNQPVQTNETQVNFITNEELDKRITALWKTDFPDSMTSNKVAPSIEDKRVLDHLEKTRKTSEGRYMFAMPWNIDVSSVDSNYKVAEKRAELLRRKLISDDMLRDGYVKAIRKYLDNDYAKKLDDSVNKAEKGTWYIPHHAVVNEKKRKVRVVFDCAAKYKGCSLNDLLYQGPDLVNSLVGILLRFRMKNIALISDVESMYCRVRVYPQDERMLRFLWWENEDFKKDPSVYCMTSHVFGAKSSACVAGFAVQSCIEEAEKQEKISPDSATLARKNFYVDDFLSSADTTEDAIRIAHEVTRTLAMGGFRLTKWLSNDRKLIESFPREERAEAVKEMSIDDKLPYERTLGLMLDIEADVFRFNTGIKEQPTTRRGILSMASSIFDPIGFLSPVFLIPKLILQRLTREKVGWDESISAEAEESWSKWFTKLGRLNEINIDRCVTRGLREIRSTELHFFSDASQFGYASVAYLKVTDTNGNFRINLLMSKARVAPQTTIPRLELSAAVLSARMWQMVNKELDLDNVKTYFWTDSMCVLRYIQNTRSQFKIFVANRLEIIHDATDVARWFFVPTKQNPADACFKRFVSRSNGKDKGVHSRT